MELHKPMIFTDGGPWAEHDHACAVCHEKKSVLFLNTGVFEPCWKCQGEGYTTIKAPMFLRPFLRRYRK